MGKFIRSVPTKELDKWPSDKDTSRELARRAKRRDRRSG